MQELNFSKKMKFLRDIKFANVSYQIDVIIPYKDIYCVVYYHSLRFGNNQVLFVNKYGVMCDSNGVVCDPCDEPLLGYDTIPAIKWINLFHYSPGSVYYNSEEEAMARGKMLPLYKKTIKVEIEDVRDVN